MLADLTHEEFCNWLECFRQNPWDERRKDDRNAVAAMWGLVPHINDDADFTPPGFIGPEYTPEKDSDDSFRASVARLEALKRKKQLDG